MSAAAPTSAFVLCSGAQYSGEPSACLSSVSRVSPSAAFEAKSMIFTRWGRHP
jgi:hypothetical protein